MVERYDSSKLGLSKDEVQAEKDTTKIGEIETDPFETADVDTSDPIPEDDNGWDDPVDESSEDNLIGDVVNDATKMLTESTDASTEEYVEKKIDEPQVQPKVSHVKPLTITPKPKNVPHPIDQNFLDRKKVEALKESSFDDFDDEYPEKLSFEDNSDTTIASEVLALELVKTIELWIKYIKSTYKNAPNGESKANAEIAKCAKALYSNLDSTTIGYIIRHSNELVKNAFVLVATEWIKNGNYGQRLSAIGVIIDSSGFDATNENIDLINKLISDGILVAK